MTPPFRQPVDFVAWGPDGRRVAAIETKRRATSTPEWATLVREGAISGSSDLGQVPVFVLVALDHIYVWLGPSDAGAPPTRTFDTQAALAWYFEQIGVTAADIHPLAFESLVGWWLDDLASGRSEQRGAAFDREVSAALEGSAIGRQAA